MAPALDNQADVVITYELADRSWLQRELLPTLMQAGLRVYTEHRMSATRNHISGRATLVLLSQQSRTHEYLQVFSAVNRQSEDIPVPIVVQLEQCAIPEHIVGLRRFDLSNSAMRPKQLRRLLRALAPKLRIACVYAAGSESNAALARVLFTCLARVGHQISSWRDVDVLDVSAGNVPPLADIDALIVLLSAASMHSELLTAAVAVARQRFLAYGRPRLLPVCISNSAELPYEMALCFDPPPCVVWNGPADTRRLVVELHDAISLHKPLEPLRSTTHQYAIEREPATIYQQRAAGGNADVTAMVPTPPSQANPYVLAQLFVPGAAPVTTSQLYVERTADAKLRRLLAYDAGLTITIRAPYQSGKSLLVLRSLSQARRGTAIFVDLQAIDPAFLTRPERLLYYLATVMAKKLHLPDASLKRAWAASTPASTRLTNWIEDYLLPNSTGRITLVLDEADRLIDTPYRDSFFGMLRSWNNNRASKDIWNRLDLIMVIATEPNILIQSANQSPFNVGYTIELDDFAFEQVAELGKKYQVSLPEHDLQSMFTLLGGHPFLSARAFYTLATLRQTWPQLADSTTTDEGPFGDHLRRYFWLLREHADLQQALKDIIEHGHCSDDLLFFRLTQLGLAKGIDAQSCACRCELYAAYFKTRL